MQVKVATEIAIRAVCNGYTTLHMNAPNGQCWTKITAISSGIPTAQVIRSVIAKLRMKYSLVLRCFLLSKAPHKTKFAAVPMIAISV